MGWADPTEAELQARTAVSLMTASKLTDREDVFNFVSKQPSAAADVILLLVENPARAMVAMKILQGREADETPLPGLTG